MLSKLTSWLAVLSVSYPGLIGLIVGAVGMVFGPLLFLFSINAVFAVGAAYTLKTWFASLFLLWTASYVIMSPINSLIRELRLARLEQDLKRASRPGRPTGRR